MQWYHSSRIVIVAPFELWEDICRIGLLVFKWTHVDHANRSFSCRPCSIAFEGRILIIGFASGDIPKVPANIVMLKSVSVVGVFWGSYSMRHPVAFMESVQAVLGALAEGKINPHISAAFPLSQVSSIK